jgi:transcriptional regulator with GAF, ATPase, and Fis domain
MIPFRLESEEATPSYSESGIRPPTATRTPFDQFVRRVEFLGMPAVIASPSMQRMMEMVEKVAWTDSTVLITGESGVGKELIARAVHYYSARRVKPFVDVNCAAFPESLIESELFGYEKGKGRDATDLIAAA